MIYFILILFFASLLGIFFMIGRKLALQDGQFLNEEENISRVAYWEEWKYLTVRNLKKYSYKSLVATIRFYVKSSAYVKNKYQELKSKIKSLRGN